MWKHIIFQSLCELILLVFIYIFGPSFIKEDKKIILNSHFELFTCFGVLPGDVDYIKKGNYILDGRENSWSKNKYINLKIIENEKYSCKKFLSSNEEEWKTFSLYDAFDYYNFEYGSTTHMTMIYNIFVFYTLFNQINCRIINDSLNICSRINKSFMFIFVTLFEMLIQILIIEFGSGIFHCVYKGLSFYQWRICFLFSMTTFFFNFGFKFIPLEKLINKYLEKKELQKEINNVQEIELEMEMGEIVNNDNKKIDENLIYK
jgi:hypothetical protein